MFSGGLCSCSGTAGSEVTQGEGTRTGTCSGYGLAEDAGWDVRQDDMACFVIVKEN